MALEYGLELDEFYRRTPRRQATMIATVRMRDKIRAAQEQEAERLADRR